MDEIMLKHIGRSDLELHASPIRSVKGVWRSFPKDKREAILKDTLNYIKENYPRQFILFGAVISNSGKMFLRNYSLSLQVDLTNT